MRRLLSFVLVAGTLGLAACGSNPCEELRRRLCEAGGPDACGELEKVGPMASDGHKRACAAVLSDEETFEMQLKALARGR